MHPFQISRSATALVMGVDRHVATVHIQTICDMVQDYPSYYARVVVHCFIGISWNMYIMIVTDEKYVLNTQHSLAIYMKTYLGSRNTTMLPVAVDSLIDFCWNLMHVLEEIIAIADRAMNCASSPISISASVESIANRKNAYNTPIYNIQVHFYLQVHTVDSA